MTENFNSTTEQIILDKIRADFTGNHHIHYSYQVPSSDSVTWVLDSADLLLIMTVVLLSLVVLLAVLSVIFYAIKYRSDVIAAGLNTVKS